MTDPRGAGPGPSPRPRFGARPCPDARTFLAREVPHPVLVLAPHPDDETLGCGGLLGSGADTGELHVCFATDGARSHVNAFGTRDPTPAEMAAIRRREATRALDELGIPRGNRSFLEFDDGGLGAAGPRLEARLARLIDRIQPGTVVLPFRGDQHPDHVRLARAAISRLRIQRPATMLLEYFIYPYLGWRGRIDVRSRLDARHLIGVNVTAGLPRKRRAIAAHASQTTRFAPGQSRPILTQEMLRAYLEDYEYYLMSARADRLAPGRRPSPWLSTAERLRPPLKRLKDRALRLVARRDA
ncbi:MAG: PIG-L deacetylase family protein [Gemmatimonadota bacterium]